MTDSGIKYYPGKFATALERHERKKLLLLINVSFGKLIFVCHNLTHYFSGTPTETSAIQDMMLESMDLDGVKYLAVRVDLDSVGAKLRLLESKCKLYIIYIYNIWLF